MSAEPSGEERLEQLLEGLERPQRGGLGVRWQVLLGLLVVVVATVALSGAAVTEVVQRGVEGGGKAASAARGLVWLYLGLSGGVMLALAYGLLTRLVIRPLRDIAEGTQRLASGALGTRVPVRTGNEVGELARGFNRMARQIERQQAALAAQVAALERSNAELAQAQDSLIRSERLATVGRLAAGVAHEVGNPLSAVLGYLELLEEGGLEEGEGEDLVRRMKREVGRIDGTIRDLLDYARVSPSGAAPGALGPAVESALELVRAQPRFREVEVEVSMAPGLPWAVLHEGRLQQVMVNLLLNAADAMGGRGVVWVRGASGEEGVVVLEVEDSGPGVPAEAQGRIFEPFFTTKGPGEGTGLGLAICQSIVEAWGGSLSLRQEAGRGACFVVRLRGASGESGGGSC